MQAACNGEKTTTKGTRISKPVVDGQTATLLRYYCFRLVGWKRWQCPRFRSMHFKLTRIATVASIQYPASNQNHSSSSLLPLPIRAKAHLSKAVRTSQPPPPWSIGSQHPNQLKIGDNTNNVGSHGRGGSHASTRVHNCLFSEKTT